MKTRPTRVFVVATLLSSSLLATDGENNRLHEFIHVEGKGLASGWDGRLVFDATYLGLVGGENKFGWSVQVFRPEKVGASGDPRADIQDVPDLLSSSVIFDWDDDSPGYGVSPGLTDGRLHLAVYPDPEFAENPFPSDRFGAADPLGGYETYEIKIVGKYEDILSATIGPQEKDKLLGRHGIRVVVRNPRTASAEIESVSVHSPVRLLTAGPEVLHGFEPTTSMDGRLLIWQGHPYNNSRIRFVMYSYNPDPHAVDSLAADVDDAGWSYPLTISAMYSTHGPGAVAETVLPDGTRFSDQYPIARQPLSVFSSEGGIDRFVALDANTPLIGAYPWLSWDASELFFPYMPDFKAHLRSAFSVIGARTRWRLEHIDGPINWTRGNVTDAVDNFNDPVEGLLLTAAYESLTEDVNPHSPPSRRRKHDYETLLVAPLGLGHSMWSVSPGDPEASIPYFGGRDTYAMITSHSGRYFEVPLFRSRDGRFIASFPFNEALKLDQATARLLVETPQGTPLHWELVRDAVTYQATQTLDISGHGIVGALRDGAAFPFDYNDAKAEWQSTRALNDFTEGLKGNSIYFPPGSYVEATIEGDLVRSMAGKSGWALSFWLKPLADLTPADFMFVSLGSSLIYVENRGSTIKFGIRNEVTTERLADIDMIAASEVLSQGAGWRNIALSYHRGVLSMYLDGTFIGKEPLLAEAARYLESALSDGMDRSLRIGPRSLPGPGTSAVLMMDEVDLLSSPLDPRTLGRLSFSGALAEPAPAQPLVALGRQLFFDTRLSGNQRISCATCHKPAASYGDDAATSPGIYGRAGSRNTPALVGSSPGHSKMLTASIPDAESQWLLPLRSVAEMGVDPDVVLDRLALDSDLVLEMQTIFGSGPSAENVGAALAAYLDSISLRADLDDPAIVEHAGRKLFLGKARCANCHNGPRLSDGHLHSVGLTTDPGRQLDTGLAQDFGKFRTSPLLGLSASAPYFHDGSASTLMQVVEDYNEGFLDNPSRSADIRPLNLEPEEIEDLASFLGQIPTGSTVPDVPALGNNVLSYGFGCGQSQCFWMVVEGVLPTSVAVELRDVGSGAVLDTMVPIYELGQGTTVLKGALSGDLLATFLETGLLLNIRYANENGRIIRSGPRFVRSDESWPGHHEMVPTITNAGAGGSESDWLWIAATGIHDYTVVEVSNPLTGEVLGLHSGAANKIWGYDSAVVTPDFSPVTGEVKFKVAPSLHPLFANSGLRVRLINRHFTNHPVYESNEWVVSSPGLGGF